MSSKEYRYSCYLCNDFKTNNVEDYESHVLYDHTREWTIEMREHPHNVYYSTEADLERFGLKAQKKELGRK